MEYLITAAVYLGYAMTLIGLLGIWGSSIAFMWRASREGILWGFACVLIPIASFIFAMRYWREVRGVVQVHLASILIVIVGVGLVLSDPEKRTMVVNAVQDKEALMEGIESVRSSPEERKSRRSTKEKEHALALQREQHQRAVELYNYVQAWREELTARQAKQTNASASEEQTAAFRAEYANYQGLLEEYKTLAAEVKEAESAAASAAESEPEPEPSPSPAASPKKSPKKAPGKPVKKPTKKRATEKPEK